MGQLFSSEEELSQAKEAIGSLLYAAMLEGGAVPDLAVAHPLLLANHSESLDSRTRLQQQLQQLQGDIGKRAPTYLKDLIGRLSTFSDEPRLAGLVGLVVTMVMDMAYAQSTGKPGGSSSCQKVCELQEVMEEYLKRCRINLSDRSRLTQDSIRLEAQLSFSLTQLKTCLLGGDCDSRSLRQWASGAAFHAQMLVHLAGLEGQAEPLAARAALDQYRDDLTQILPAYRRYKVKTVCVVKSRGGFLKSHDVSSEVAEEGAMTGLNVTDREMGKSVTVPLAAMETETGKIFGRGGVSSCSSINLDQISSDQLAKAYLDRLFSEQGPVEELRSHFSRARDQLSPSRPEPRDQVSPSRPEPRDQLSPSRPEPRDPDQHRTQTLTQQSHRARQAEGTSREQAGDDCTRRPEERERRQGGEDSLKLSIVETQLDQSV
ncbi:uncharacterized protein LOC143009771 isoform X2 [Genypterus blacodes]|uniref:uncharacterized protein LOC143009771 isoform X2 n=1 Tax=Genypterus blacodes TaxID=154954 RepID=UPI003F767FD6